MDEKIVGQEPSDDSGNLSLEQLKDAQQAHEAELAEQRRKKEAELQHQKELEEQAGDAYTTRADLAAELKEVELGIEEAHAAQIQERLDEVDRLRESQLQKEVELSESQKEFNSLAERLAAINALVEGKHETEIAEVTKKALERAQNSFDALLAKRTIIIDEIGKIKMGQISDEEIVAYKALVERQQKIAEQLMVLEENPALIELLTQEAENEAQLRNTLKAEVFREALRYHNMTPERRELIEKLTDQFLTEEISFREINKIKDPQQKMQAMRALAQVFIESFAIQDMEALSSGRGIHDYNLIKDQFIAGKLLQNLACEFGSQELTISLLGFSVRVMNDGPQNLYDYDSQNGLAQGVKRHVGSLNILRAYSIGLKNDAMLRQEIMGTYNNWQSIEDKIRSTQEITVGWGEGPIIPNDASPAQKAKIEKEYESNYKVAQELIEIAIQKQEQEKHKKEQEKHEKKVSMEGELKQLKARLARLEEVNSILLNKLNRNRLERSIDARKEELRRNNASLNDCQTEIATINPLSFIRKRELQREREGLVPAIEQGAGDLKRLQSQFEEMQKLTKEQEEIGDALTIVSQIRYLEYELNRSR